MFFVKILSYFLTSNKDSESHKLIIFLRQIVLHHELATLPYSQNTMLVFRGFSKNKNFQALKNSCYQCNSI